MEQITFAIISGIAILIFIALAPMWYRRHQRIYGVNQTFRLNTSVMFHLDKDDFASSPIVDGTVFATCWSDTPWEVEFVVQTHKGAITVQVHRDDLRDAVVRGHWGNESFRIVLAKPLGMSKSQARLTLMIMESHESAMNFDFALSYFKVKRLVKFWDRVEPNYSRHMGDEVSRTVDKILQSPID